MTGYFDSNGRCKVCNAKIYQGDSGRWYHYTVKDHHAVSQTDVTSCQPKEKS